MMTTPFLEWAAGCWKIRPQYDL